MCPKLNLSRPIKLVPIIGIVMAMGMVTKTQMYQNPCPQTFQYEMDQNGELYGTVGVYAFDENVVQLEVDLSVGNHVNGYNGRIELGMPKEQVLSAIQRQTPITYKVLFPRWENVPPRVTRITVNGQVVCRGSPLQLNGWFRIITSITLQHRFTIKVASLSNGNPFFPDNSVTGNVNQPLGSNSAVDNGRKRFPSLVLPDDAFDERKDYQSNFFELSTTTTTARPTPRPTTRPTARPTTRPTTRFTTRPTTTTNPTGNRLPVNDLLFGNNPFFGGRVTTAAAPPRRSQTNKPNTNLIDSSNICGSPVVAVPLVVYGEKVPPGAFPWLIAIFAYTGIGVNYKCSGSLVSKKHVITAAHCVQDGRQKIPPSKFLFMLGKNNIESFLLQDGEKMVGAEEIHVHEDYVLLSADADIAVVVLNEEIQFTKHIRPICIWSEADDINEIVNQRGKVIGWGKDEHNNSMTPEPKQVTIPVASQEQCLRSAEIFRFITSSRSFCAGERNGSGPCNGDSGSGFIMKRNDRWFLRGVVSISPYDTGNQTCDLSHYVVFTDVSKFRPWLSSKIVI